MRVEWVGVGVTHGETGCGALLAGWDNDACLSRDTMDDWLIPSFGLGSSAAGRGGGECVVEMVRLEPLERLNQFVCDGAAYGAVIARDNVGGASSCSVGGGGGVEG